MPIQNVRVAVLLQTRGICNLAIEHYLARKLQLMRIFKKLLVALIVLLITVGIAAYIYLNTFKPNYNESVDLKRMSSAVEAYYDEFGIPHIYADNEPDLFRAFGYIHAKDRLWQMELVRRIAPGRLSEILGEKLLETDRFFRMTGISQYSTESLAHFRKSMDSKVRQNTLAYLDGINQYIDQGKAPIEFKILGLEMAPFSPIDVYNVVGYMALSFAVAHETDPLLTYILEKHGSSYLSDLMVHVDSSTTLISSTHGNESIKDLSIHVHNLTKLLPLPEFIGSNSWVLSGEKTKSGKVILANDPHIGYSSPSVWYEAYLNAPTFESYGYFLAGFPFPQLMHNEQHAIGLTMMENDDIDFFSYSQNSKNGDQYLYKGEWNNFEKRKETIRIKDKQDYTFTVKSTVHGPIVNDAVNAIQSDTPVSMYWTYTKFPNKGLEASYFLNTSKSMDEARNAASMIHAPGLNIMYGDSNGNVAWWASAKLLQRPDHVNSKLILDGSSGVDDPVGFYEIDRNPMAENPDWEYVYSANNQPIVNGYALYPGYYLPEDRARRIVKLLEDKDDWTVEEVKKMMTDVISENAKEVSNIIADVLSQSSLSDLENEVVLLLKNWSGSYSLHDKTPLVYNKLVYHINHLAMADELGDELFEVYNGNHVMKRSIQTLFSSQESPWWDDVGTENKIEGRSEVFLKALQTTCSELENQFGIDTQSWEWQKAHTLEHNHVFSAVPILKKYFNIGPFPVPGNVETINNFMFEWTSDGTYEVVAGPSTRRIVDFANISNNSWSILPTGQSGNVMSPHYRDQAEKHAKGKFRRMLMDRDEIIESSIYKTTFNKKN